MQNRSGADRPMENGWGRMGGRTALALDAFALDTLLGGLYAADGELRTRDELDLAGRTDAVIDKHSLPEPQIDDLALAINQFGGSGHGIRNYEKRHHSDPSRRNRYESQLHLF